MSRIGKQPIDFPEKVELTLDGNTVKVKGPLGELSYTAPEGLILELNERQLVVTIAQQTRKLRALHGLVRTLINNMVVGVSQGFTKELELVGVGYRSQVQGKVLNLTLGYSHPIEIPIPEATPAPVRLILIVLPCIRVIVPEARRLRIPATGFPELPNLVTVMVLPRPSLLSPPISVIVPPLFSIP